MGAGYGWPPPPSARTLPPSPHAIARHCLRLVSGRTVTAGACVGGHVRACPGHRQRPPAGPLAPARLLVRRILYPTDCRPRLAPGGELAGQPAGPCRERKQGAMGGRAVPRAGIAPLIARPIFGFCQRLFPGDCRVMRGCWRGVAGVWMAVTRAPSLSVYCWRHPPVYRGKCWGWTTGV